MPSENKYVPNPTPTGNSNQQSNVTLQQVPNSYVAPKPPPPQSAVMAIVNPPKLVQSDPDANPYYGQSKAINEQITGKGTGGTGTDANQGGAPAQILSKDLAQSMGVPTGTIVPSGTLVTPSTSPNMPTTIVTPAVGKQPAITTTVTKSADGTITRTTDSGQVTTITPDGKTTTTSASVFPTSFKPTGNTTTDLTSLVATGASLAAIEIYMTQNKLGYNNLPQDLRNSLDKLGYVQPQDGEGFYTFIPQIAGAPTTGVGAPQPIQIPISQYNSWTPQQQFTFQQSIGQVPKNATIKVNDDGTWEYERQAEITVKYDPFGAPIMTPALLNYLKTNNPEVYNAIQSQGSAYAWGQYADVISTAITSMIGGLPESQRLAIAQEYGIVPKTATSVVVNEDGTLSYTVGQPQGQTFDYSDWANQLPTYYKSIYDEKGGNKTGFDAVQAAQTKALAEVEKYGTFATTNIGQDGKVLPDGEMVGYTKYDFTKIDPSTWLLAGFSMSEYGTNKVGIKNALIPQPIIPTLAISSAFPQRPSTNLTTMDVQTILKQLAPYGKTVEKEGMSFSTPGNLPTTTQYDYAKALYDKAVTKEQLIALLGSKNSDYVNGIQNQLDGINKTVGYFNNNIKVTENSFGDPVYNYNLTNAEISSLSNAIRNAGISWDVSKQSVFQLWDAISPDQKYQIAKVYNTYVNPKSMVESTEITFQQYLADNRLNNIKDITKLPIVMFAGLGSGIIQPYAQNETVGDLAKQMIPYVVKDDKGNITGYDLTKYLNDNPENTPQLIAGGFKSADIQSAQSGKDAIAKPQKASVMEWVTSGLLTATLVTPVVSPFVGSAEGLISLGELGATSAVFVPQYVKGIPEMTWTERVVYGGLLAAPFIPIGKDLVVYGVRKPIDIATDTYNTEDIRLQKGMPSVDVNPNISEALGIDNVKVGQRAVQNAETDIFVSDPNGNYVDRLNPLQRASNLLNTKDTYEFTSHGTAKLFTDAIEKTPDMTFNDLSGKTQTAKLSDIKINVDQDNKLIINPDNNVSVLDNNNKAIGYINQDAANDALKPPSYITNVPRTGAYKDQVGSLGFASENAWIERGADTGDSLVIEGHIVDKNIGYNQLPTEVQKLVDTNDYKGAQKLLVQMNENGELAGMRFPAFRMLADGTPFIEPESVYGKNTVNYIVGQSSVRSPVDVFKVMPVADISLADTWEIPMPENFDSLSQYEKEAWYKSNGVISEYKAAELDAMKPINWEDMTSDQQQRWLYDNDAAIKTVSKGQKIPIYWTSTDPNAKPPDFITRVSTELGTEPYTRLKRILKIFDPNRMTVTSESGEVSRLPGIKAIELDAQNEGQIHVGQYNNERFNIKVPNAQPDGTGTVVFGDRHGTYGDIKGSVNWAYDDVLISGSNGSLKLVDPQSEHIIFAGDISDRGADTLKLWNDLINLQSQTEGSQAKIDLLLGNHDLAHITGKEIEGIDYNDANYESKLSGLIKENILNGNIKAATVTDKGQLVTHAGLSLDQFPEYAGKDYQFIADDLNRRLITAVQNNDYTDPMFNRGRLDGGDGTGGIFWYRPSESADSQVLPNQIVGHTPTITRGGTSWAVQDRGNLTLTDAATWWDNPNTDRVSNFYADTPTTQSIKTGDILAKPTEISKGITLPLQPDLQATIKSLGILIKDSLGDSITLKDPSQVGLTIKVPENIDDATLAKFNEQVKQIIDNTKGEINYGLVGGSPNNYNPSFVYLGLADDESLANLVALQKQIDVVSNSLGYKSGDFKVQAGITLGEFSDTDPLIGQKLLDILRNQQEDVTKTQINKYQSSGDVELLSDKMKQRIAESQKSQDDLNKASVSENNYPPQVPSDSKDVIDLDKGQLVVNKYWTPLSTISGATVQEIRDASLAAEARTAIEEYPIKPDDEISKIASNYIEYNPDELANKEKTELRLGEKQPIEVRQTEIPLVEKTIPEKTTSEVPVMEKIVTEKPVVEKTIIEKPIAEKQPLYNQPPYTLPPYVQPPYINIPYKPPPPEIIPPPQYTIIDKTSKSDAKTQEVLALIKPLTLTWKQGKVRWILPPKEDGTYDNEDKFAVSYKTQIPGVTKYAEGEGSAQATLELIGGKSKVPFKDTDVDIGWAMVHIAKVGDDFTMNVIPSDEANWEGVNKYTKLKDEATELAEYREWRAQYTGKPPVGMPKDTPIIASVKPFKDSPPEMHKAEWTQYSNYQGSPIKVYKVDGKWVRENLDPDFTAGGHNEVYTYIPKNQVWIERMRNPEEDETSLAHELDELYDMKHNDENYAVAHQQAVEREFGVVRKSNNISNEVESSLSKFVPASEEQTKPENIPEMKMPKVVTKSRKKAIMSDNKRYYLGHETRQPELVANI